MGFCTAGSVTHRSKRGWDSTQPTGERAGTLVRVACKCQREADEAEKRRTERERFKQDMARRREDGISSPDGLRHTFAQDDRAEVKVSDACRRHVEHWNEMRAENIGILFHGTGKSFYASCIGNGLLEKRVPVAATNFPRLLNLLQGTQGRALQQLSRRKRYCDAPSTQAAGSPTPDRRDGSPGTSGMTGLLQNYYTAQRGRIGGRW